MFGSAERLPQREAVDAMNYTVSCLKVRCATQDCEPLRSQVVCHKKV